MDSEDNNNKSTTYTFPEDYNFEGKLIELTPENELKFVEGKLRVRKRKWV